MSMKKKALLFTLITGISYLTLVSYNAGPAQSAGNRTGGPGSSGQTCAGGGCHSAASSATSVAIKLKDAATGTDVTDGKYVPLRTYEVQITVSNASRSSFGFQAMALGTTDANIGQLTAGAGQHTRTVSNRTIVEHSSHISGTTATFTWISPPAGSGTATFHAAGNAVNANGGSDGDFPSLTYSVAFSENNTSVGTLANAIDVLTYPNPFSNVLNVKMDNVTSGEYTLTAFDLRGKMLYQHTEQVNSGKFEGSINTFKWAAGNYFIQISKDGVKHTRTVVKL